MPLLTATDPLSGTPRRVLVAGTSGSGKTTLGIAIAAALDLPHVEIDALYHGPDWTPRASFVADVTELVERPGWVTEWQYDDVRPLLVSAADLLVWLDLTRTRVMWQLTRRTLRRRLRRQRLWNGNVEPPLWTFLTDRDHIVRWAWRTYPRNAALVRAALADRPDLSVVRLTGHSAAQGWLTGPLAAVRRGG